MVIAGGVAAAVLTALRLSGNNVHAGGRGGVFECFTEVAYNELFMFGYV